MGTLIKTLADMNIEPVSILWIPPSTIFNITVGHY
jgi:hypothetical protein